MTKENDNLTPLTLESLENIHREFARFVRVIGGEPLPSFETADKDTLQSVLHTVEAEYSGKSNYETLVEKAVAYLYFLNKSHPLQNGNKRFSIICFDTYLLINGYELDASHDFLREVAILIAQSDPDEKDALMDGLVRFIEENDLIVKQEE